MQNFIDYNQDVATADLQIYLKDTEESIGYWQSRIDEDLSQPYPSALTPLGPGLGTAGGAL